MKPANEAWLALGVGVTAYEIFCPKGETLSEGCDRAIERHPVLTVGLIGVTALHLANLLPPAIDPFSRILEFVKERQL